MTSSKKIRLCGHIVNFTTSKNNNEFETKNSDMSFIIFNTPVYYSSIVSYLSLFENLNLSILSNFQNNFYKNKNNKLFLKKLISYDYNKQILKWDFDVKKIYTDHEYLINLINKYGNTSYKTFHYNKFDDTTYPLIDFTAILYEHSYFFLHFI